MSSKKTKRILILSVSTFVLLLGVGIFLHFFIKHKVDDFIVLQQEVSSARESDVLALKFKFNQLEPSMQKIDGYIVDSNNVVIFLNQLDRFAERVGVSLDIQSVDLRDATESRGGKESRSHGELIVATRVLGDWQSIMNLLLLLESIDKKVFLQSVRLSSVFNEEGTSWSALITLRAITN